MVDDVGLPDEAAGADNVGFPDEIVVTWDPPDAVLASDDIGVPDEVGGAPRCMGVGIVATAVS